MTALRTLARTCYFRDVRDSLIRDRIVLGFVNPRLCIRLLAAGDPDLPKTLEICRAEEISSAQSRRMASDTQAISKVTVRQPPEIEECEPAQVAALRQRQSATGPGEKKCSRCGRHHQPRRCPAWGKTCGKCRGANHFATMCRTMTVNIVRASNRSSSGAASAAIGEDGALQASHCEEKAYAVYSHSGGKESVSIENSYHHQRYTCFLQG